MVGTVAADEEVDGSLDDGVASPCALASRGGIAEAAVDGRFEEGPWERVEEWRLFGPSWRVSWEC